MRLYDRSDGGDEAFAIAIARNVTIARSELLVRRRFIQQKFNESVLGQGSVYDSLFDRRQCVFIHIPKCGGTSVAEVLFGRSPWHFSARQFRAINRAKFDRYFRFAVVRNPWARLYSIYRYAPREAAEIKFSPLGFIAGFPNFEAFVKAGLSESLVRGFNFLRPLSTYLQIDGKPAVDYVVRLESAESDMQKVFERLPQCAAPLPHRNGSGSIVRLGDVYSPAMARKVGQFYGNDIRLFGYDFGGRDEAVTGASPGVPEPQLALPGFA